MSSRDPYAHIPNLTGQSAVALDETHGADPSRFYPSARAGVVDAVTGRILDVPRCAAYRLTNHNVPTLTYTVIGMDTIDYDNDGMIDLGSTLLSSRATCRTRGVYDFRGMILWPTPAAVSFRNIGILLNGVLWKNLEQQPATAGPHSQTIEGRIPLEPGDYVEMGAQQNTGGTIALLGNGNAVRDISFEMCMDSTFGSDEQ